MNHWRLLVGCFWLMGFGGLGRAAPGHHWPTLKTETCHAEGPLLVQNGPDFEWRLWLKTPGKSLAVQLLPRRNAPAFGHTTLFSARYIGSRATGQQKHCLATWLNAVRRREADADWRRWAQRAAKTQNPVASLRVFSTHVAGRSPTGQGESSGQPPLWAVLLVLLAGLGLATALLVRWRWRGALAALGVLLLMAEALARLWLPAPLFRSFLHLGPGWVTWWGQTPLWESPHAPRHRWPLSLAATGSRPLLVLGVGDSVMHGLKPIGQDDTFLAQAARAMPRYTNRPVRAVNLAVPGYVAWQEKAVLARALRKATPDLVVWQLWMDDWGGVAVAGNRVFGGPVQPLSLRRTPLGGKGPLRFVVGPLMDRSRVVGWLAWRGYVGRGGRFVTGEALFRRTVADMAQMARARGASLVVVLGADLSGKRPVQPQVYEMIRPLLRQHGIAFFEAAPAFGKASAAAVRLDTCCHLNRRGHRALGRWLAPRLAVQVAGE